MVFYFLREVLVFSLQKKKDICTRLSLLWQISGQSVGEVKVVDDMHQRKAEMARQSEAFIALPGARYTIGRFSSHHHRSH